jgi:hypothetical protein
MLDLSFEIISETNINIEYLYGTEKFTLNIFQKDGYWMIHPFNGILLYNLELCKNVFIELFKNKNFQVMLAKQDILLSSLRTSIDLESRNQLDDPYKGEDFKDSTNRISEYQDYIDNNSIPDILEQEVHMLDQKIGFFNKILEKLFLNNYGPGDYEFDKIQAIVHAYKEAKVKIASHANK